MVDGFLLTREWHERDETQDLVFWLSTATGPVQVTVQSHESVCFVPAARLPEVQSLIGAHRSAPVALRSFAGEAVVACYFRSQKALNIARSKLEQAGCSVLEADLRPTDRYLMERFITGSAEVVGDGLTATGYTTFVNPRLRPSAYQPSLRVLSLDIETSWTEEVLYSIALYGVNETVTRRVFMVGEPGMDVADHVEFFADEAALIRHFLGCIVTIDPDVIIGWSVVAFDLQFLQRRCTELAIPFSLGRANEPVRWRTGARGQTRSHALVPGRVVLDGIELLRTATYSFESFSLEYVSRQLLGRGKLIEDVDARAVHIQDMFREDKARLAEYNLEDCVLVWEIFERTQLISFAIERSRLTGLDMDRPGGSVAAFDFLYLPRLHRKGYVAPVVNEASATPSPGGYVLESRPGLYDHVIVLDFKSLYPSIIRTFHVDPLAMVAATEVDPIPGFGGASFSREQYILPDIIRDLWRARDGAKHAGKTAMAQAIKIIMNSFYGVLGTPGCRFFDPRLVSSITLRGHEILRQTRDLIQAQGYTVIYGDTDSVFVLLPAVTDADQTGADLTAYLNQWWQAHIATRFGVESCLEVEYEMHFERFLMPTVRGSEKGSKKRYAGMTCEQGERRLVFKGLETVRSDWSQLAREFQQALYGKIFRDEAVESFIKDTVRAVLQGERDEQLVLRRRLRRKLVDYRKNVPPHVRAARLAETIRQERGLPRQYENGGWIEYLMTVNGPEPKAYLASPLDYRFYIDRQLGPVADAILAFRATSLAKILDRQLNLF
jgi:DNA polymerase II